MLFFVGHNTPVAPVRSPSERNFHTYQYIFKTITSIFNIKENSTRECIQLPVTELLNSLLLININLQLVVCNLHMMSSFLQGASRCLIQSISLRFFLTTNLHVMNSYRRI